MIVFPRKIGESIVIDGKIILTIMDIRGDKVRLQLEAPKEVSVHRKEVYDALHRAGDQTSFDFDFS
jgi:carbon storage regulator